MAPDAALQTLPPDPPAAPLDESAPPEPHSAWKAERIVRGWLPWLASLLVNLTIAVVLALIALPMITRGGVHEVTFSQLIEEEGDEVTTIEVALVAEASEATMQQDEQVVTAVREPDEIPLDRQTSVDPASQVTGSIVDPEGNMPLLPPRGVLTMPLSVSSAPQPLTERQLNRAATVEDAVDGVGEQIREMLDEGDLLVVWLLDSSLSLIDDRQRVAARLTEVYSEIGEELAQRAKVKGVKVPKLTNAVVAYGAVQAEVEPPHRLTGRAVAAIREIPIDPTGVENVMTAVSKCAIRYSGSASRRTLIVVWTDESGDDILALEPTIAICRQNRVKVSIIGPTAVLGAQEGTHTWTHQPTGQLFHLPVLKGPDTAFPERLSWAYWWTARLPQWHDPELGTREDYHGWFGGPHLAATSSGFPPYALTRLAVQTGGTMTIFDRPIDRGPYKLEDLRPYAPDYRSAAEIMEELRYFPLRQMVLVSVDVTRSKTPPIPPKMDYQYIGAPRLRRILGQQEFLLRDEQAFLETALAPFGPKGREDLYQAESSPRWRAWYDLTYGRLLAQSVRYAEARALFLLLSQPGGIPDNANCVDFAPSARILAGKQSQERAREAERLLRRCLEKNPKTPWAYLAQRELDHPLGLTHSAYYREPPRPVPFIGPYVPPPVIVPPKL
jgi:hypothetical protein